jgi:DNA-binding NarL/FixJ family response regulator
MTGPAPDRPAPDPPAPDRSAPDPPPPGRPLRVLVADDQAVVRIGFTAMLDAQPDMTVVGAAADGRQAVSLARELHPDVVLMDIRMPVLDGIEATRQLNARDNEHGAMDAGKEPPKVLVLTTFDLDDYVYDALRAGASGFLLKDATPEEILAAVRVIGAGDALLAPSVTRRLIAEFASRAKLTAPPELDRLTAREREVLLLVAGGLTNSEIAGRLYLAEQTVKSHVGSILLKLRLRDRVQAVILAYESGVVVAGAKPQCDAPM